MSTIKVSEMAPVQVNLEADPTGETWVQIQPPKWEEEVIREGFRSKRVHFVDTDGQFRTQTDINLYDLWMWEIWLTYVNTNLEVEITDNKEDTAHELVSFLPKEDMTQLDFFRKLRQCGTMVVSEWHRLVMDVVEQWKFPFW